MSAYNPSNDFDAINEITISAEDFNENSFMAALVDKDYDADNDVEFAENYSWKATYHQFLSLLAIFDRYPMDLLSVISKGIINTVLTDTALSYNATPLRPIDSPSGPCIPGQLRLFVNTDGNLYPCERVSENSDATNIGSLDKGFDIQKALQLLNVGAVTQESCKRCWSFRYCTTCAKQSDNGSSTLSSQFKLKHCESVRANAYLKLCRLLLVNEVEVYYSAQVRKEGVTL